MNVCFETLGDDRFKPMDAQVGAIKVKAIDFEHACHQTLLSPCLRPVALQVCVIGD